MSVVNTLQDFLTCMENNESIDKVKSATLATDSERYKLALGSALSAGFGKNELDFQKHVWPPTTPARYYINTFLSNFTNIVQGRVVEFAPSVYRGMFPKASQYDVWNVAPDNNVTIVGDLQHCPHIPDGRFDAIVCTHVLSAIRDVWSASRELYRLLDENGVLLVTVPCLLQKYAPDPKDYWRFTRDSLDAVLEPFARVKIFSFGNAITMAASPLFLRTEHFSPEVLNYHDPSAPSILAAVAWKK